MVARDRREGGKRIEEDEWRGLHLAIAVSFTAQKGRDDREERRTVGGPIEFKNDFF